MKSIGLALALLMTTHAAAQADQFGRFVGRLILSDEAIEDCFAEDVDGWFSIFRLVENFQYVDPDDTVWTVPPGVCVNGASIPAAFWSVIGGPWSGKYRRASVIHDHYVRTRERSWQDTHRVFYHGMLAGGVAERQAKMMYFAVRRFGKRWGGTTRSFGLCLDTADAPCGAAAAALPVFTPEPPGADILDLVGGMDFDRLSLEAIDEIADAQLRAAWYE